MWKKLITKVASACVLVIGSLHTAPMIQAVTVKVMSDNSNAQLELKSQAALLKDLATNQSIIEEKANKTIYPASLTKIMTIYTALQMTQNLDQTVVIPEGLLERMAMQEASVVGFEAGDTVTIRDLMYGTMLASGGDAAELLAETLSGSTEQFVTRMNDEAKKLGMSRTHFTNVTGLHDEKLVTTLNDLYTLTRTALQNQTFKEILTTPSYMAYTAYYPEGLLIESTIFSKIGESSHVILGGKTGYTDEAGQNLISLAAIDGKEYVLLTVGAQGNPMKQENWHLDDALTVYEWLSRHE